MRNDKGTVSSLCDLRKEKQKASVKGFPGPRYHAVLSPKYVSVVGHTHYFSIIKMS